MPGEKIKEDSLELEIKLTSIPLKKLNIQKKDLKK
jgi:hypothetical protein